MFRMYARQHGQDYVTSTWFYQDGAYHGQILKRTALHQFLERLWVCPHGHQNRQDAEDCAKRHFEGPWKQSGEGR